MSVDELLAQVDLLDDADFQAFRYGMIQKRKEREARALVEAGQVEVLQGIREAEQAELPSTEQGGGYSQWVDPQGAAYLAYLHGDLVHHNGTRYESVVTGLNYDQPGTSDGWVEVTTE